jgi:pimeloyl-ACP methyl ester carboxylesterase
LTEADVDYYTDEFTRTGFRGGLNWYRNIDRNWELLAPLPVTVPALYIAGDRDPVMKFPGMDQHITDLAKTRAAIARDDPAARLRAYPPEERSAKVNAAMIKFLRDL